ncbi:MAG: hypothetical protein LBV61_06965 [Burkholderiaceae bacterium]|jgi:pilus assembly protein FimV|nr:hypothetical protein [Burkholderiaceae bacterium]
MNKRSFFPAARGMAGSTAQPACGHSPITLFSAALALVLSVVSFNARALTLGEMRVLSGLGEPLRAEMTVSDISPAEAGGLRIGLASLEIFKTAGIHFNDGLVGVHLSGGPANSERSEWKIVLTGNRPVTGSFLDLLIVADWGAGRVMHDYTVLLNPPRGSETGELTPVVPARMGAAQSDDFAASGGAGLAALPMGDSAASSANSDADTPPENAARSKAGSAKAPAGQRRKQVTVKHGDTAGGIATAYKPNSVSLDQMLVAMLWANPSAFVQSNVNRMRAGAVIDIPGPGAASAIEPGQARRAVVAQSVDFNAYRRRLAANASTRHVAGASRQSAGQVQASVEDRSRAAVTSQDKVTVSSASKKGNTQLIEQRRAQDRQARTAELDRNISDLDKLEAAVKAANRTAGNAAGNATGGGTNVPALASAAPVTPPSRPLAESSWAAVSAAWGALLERPILFIIGAVFVVVLLGLLGLLFLRAPRDNRAEEDSLRFGGTAERESGAQKVSKDSPPALYLSRQPGAGDIDPVVEADRHLAGGRDLEAEGILRGALCAYPRRMAIYLKLLEIYAARRDTHAYERYAAEAYKITGGTGPDWARAAELGRTLDPGHLLYQDALDGGAISVEEKSPATVPVESAPAVAVETPVETPAVLATSATPPPADPVAPAAAAPQGKGFPVVPAVPEVSAVAAAPTAQTAQTAQTQAANAEIPAFTEASTGLFKKPDDASSKEYQGLTANLDTFNSIPMVLSSFVHDSHWMVGRVIIGESSATEIESAPSPAADGVHGTQEPSPPSMPRSSASDQAGQRSASSPSGASEIAPAKGPEGIQQAERIAPAGVDPAGRSAAAGTVPPAPVVPAPSAAVPVTSSTPPAARTAAVPPASGAKTRGTTGASQGGRVYNSTPYIVKLALAREVHALGDIEGARTLAMEVVNEADDVLREQARQFLADLG